MILGMEPLFSLDSPDVVELGSVVESQLSEFVDPQLSSSLAVVVASMVARGACASDVVERISIFFGTPAEREGLSRFVTFLDSWVSEWRSVHVSTPTLDDFLEETESGHLRRACECFDLINTFPTVSRAGFVDDSCSTIDVTLSHRDVAHNSSHFVRQMWSVNDSTTRGNFYGRLVGLPSRCSHPFYTSPSGRYAICFVSSSPTPSSSDSSSTSPKTFTAEIWSLETATVLRRIPIPSTLHSDSIVTKPPFGSPFGIGCIGWSADESRFAYVADCRDGLKKKELWEMVSVDGEDDDEEIESEGESNGDNSKKKNEKIIEKYLFQHSETFGELLSRVKCPKVFVCDISRGEINPLSGIPAHIACAQPFFFSTNETTSLVGFIGYDVSGPKLGLVYCVQRPSSLYVGSISFGETTKSLRLLSSSSSPSISSVWRLGDSLLNEDDWWNVLHPRIAPSGSKLIYFTTSRVPFHFSCHKMMAANITFSPSVISVENECPIQLSEPICLIDFVGGGISEEQQFCGLFPTEGMRLNCVSDDEKWVYFTSICRSQLCVFRVGMDENNENSFRTVQKLSVLEEEEEKLSSLSLLSIRNDKLILMKRSPILPFEILIATVDSDTTDQFICSSIRPIFNAFHLSPSSEVSSLFDGMSYAVHSFVPSHSDGPEDIPVELVVIMPNESSLMDSTSTKKKRKVIIYPHGGPHSCFVTSFFFNRTYFALLGYIVVLVNFRGSTGFGTKGIESLANYRAGTIDVQDVEAARQFVMTSILHTEEEEEEEGEEVQFSILGGSHGGFLVCHTLGQFPDRYCCGVSRNPVTNLSTFYESSDIPDWPLAVLGFDPSINGRVPTEEFAQIAFAQSPIAHVSKVVSPLFLQVGQDDLRVCPAQSRHYVQLLRSMGREVKMKVYPGNSHPLSKPAVMADCCISAAMWLFKWMK